MVVTHKYKGYSQSNWARHLGVDISTLSRWNKKLGGLEQAVKYLKEKHASKYSKWTYKGKGLDHWSKVLGLAPETIKAHIYGNSVGGKRLVKRHTLSKAVQRLQTRQKYKSNSKRVMCVHADGTTKFYRSMGEAARRMHIPQPAIISTAIKKHKGNYFDMTFYLVD